MYFWVYNNISFRKLLGAFSVFCPICTDGPCLHTSNSSILPVAVAGNEVTSMANTNSFQQHRFCESVSGIK